MLKDILSTRTTQRLIFAARVVDRSLQESGYLIDAELDGCKESNATSVELLTGAASAVAQRAIRWPIAIIAGGEEFFRRR